MDDGIPSVRTATRRPACASANAPRDDKREDRGPGEGAVYCDHLIELFCIKLSDGLDHPAIWAAWPDFVKGFPLMPARLAIRLQHAKPDDSHYVALRIGRAMCLFHDGDRAAAVADLEAVPPSLHASALMQGALRYLHGQQAEGRSPVGTR